MTKVSDLSPHVSVLCWGLEVALLAQGNPVTSRLKLASSKGNTGHMVGDQLTSDERKLCFNGNNGRMIGDELTGVGTPGKPYHRHPRMIRIALGMTEN